MQRSALVVWLFFVVVTICLTAEIGVNNKDYQTDTNRKGRDLTYNTPLKYDSDYQNIASNSQKLNWEDYGDIFPNTGM